MKRSLAIFASLVVTTTCLLSSCDNKSTNFDGGGNPSTSIPWNTSIKYGNLTDSRDGQSYRTVRISSQVWMAENLNYAGNGTTVGECYGGSSDSCARYGRLYSWTDAMGVAETYDIAPLNPVFPAQGVCPRGWHVPADSEWSTLQTVVDPTNTMDGTRLKSTSGWNTFYKSPETGTDNYGFRVLPSGYQNAGAFYGGGFVAYFWAASEIDTFFAWHRYLSRYSSNSVDRNFDIKSYGYSLRCIQD